MDALLGRLAVRAGGFLGRVVQLEVDALAAGGKFHTE